MNRLFKVTTLIATAVLLNACTPKVGSQAWCDGMKQKPKGEWTANAAADFTKYCIFK